MFASQLFTVNIFMWIVSCSVISLAEINKFEPDVDGDDGTIIFVRPPRSVVLPLGLGIDVRPGEQRAHRTYQEVPLESSFCSPGQGVLHFGS